MNSQIRRIQALEVSMNPPVTRRWHRVVQHVGVTSNLAIEAYEAEYGPIGDNAGVVVRRIVTV